ncbi:MAG: hypothetical protein WCJ39_10600, partial [bacterium]
LNFITMGNTSGAKIKHMLYNPSRHSSKSGQKPKKAVQWYVDLMMKQAKQGDTTWIQKTMVKCLARIKRYGIPQTLLDEKLASRKVNKK